MNNSAGSPSGSRRSGVPEAPRDGGVFVEVVGGAAGVPRVPLAWGAAGGCCAFIQCKPMATEWAHIFPHSRESRQVQRFSMSMGPWIRRPARKEVSPVCTTPRNRGGCQFELRT